MSHVIENYVIEVEASTHDLLQEGVLAMPRGHEGLDYSVVVVSAEEVSSDEEAVLVAAQMAACTSGGMPTRTTLIDWPISLTSP